MFGYQILGEISSRSRLLQMSSRSSLGERLIESVPRWKSLVWKTHTIRKRAFGKHSDFFTECCPEKCRVRLRDRHCCSVQLTEEFRRIGVRTWIHRLYPLGHVFSGRESTIFAGKSLLVLNISHQNLSQKSLIRICHRNRS